MHLLYSCVQGCTHFVCKRTWFPFGIGLSTKLSNTHPPRLRAVLDMKLALPRFNLDITKWHISGFKPQSTRTLLTSSPKK